MNIKVLKEQRNSLLDEIDKICNDAEKSKRILSEDEEKIVSEKMKEIVNIDRNIDIENKRHNLDDTINIDYMSDKEKIANEEKKSFVDYIKNKQSKALDVSNNGALIPKSVSKEIIDKIYELCPILQKATVVNIKGDLTVPVYDDTTDIDCDYIDDLTELTEQSGKFTSVTFTRYIAGALVIISKNLINNTDFNLLSFVEYRIAMAFAKFYSKECLTGTTKIKGIFGNTTNTVSSTKFSDNDIIALQNAIPNSFQSNACWIMNRDTLLKVKLLKDTDGKSLLNPDLRNSYGWLLLGQPVFVDMYAPDNEIAYGDLTGYWIKFSQDLEINVLYEKYSTKHAIGVIGYAEIDAKPVDQQKLAVLTVNAS